MCANPRPRLATDRCRWCGEPLERWTDGWVAANGNRHCEVISIDGCAPCEAGEPHPHEPEAPTVGLDVLGDEPEAARDRRTWWRSSTGCNSSTTAAGPDRPPGNARAARRGMLGPPGRAASGVELLATLAADTGAPDTSPGPP